MSNYAIITDLNRCTGCLACTVACKAINGVDVGNFWIKTLRVGPHPIEGGSGTFPDVEMYFLPVQCQHCENPECVKVCPTQASHVTEDGTVQIDKDKCIGCRMCMSACPYTGVRSFNWEEPRYPMDFALGDADAPKHQKHVVEKCIFCTQRGARGEQPACVADCIGRARHFGDLDDPNSEAAKVLAAAGEYAHYLFAPADLQPTTVYILSEKTAKWQEEPVEVTRYEKK